MHISLTNCLSQKLLLFQFIDFNFKLIEIQLSLLFLVELSDKLSQPVSLFFIYIRQKFKSVNPNKKL